MLPRPSFRPLPEKISLLLQEARWLALGGMSLYIGLVLFGYNKDDSGFTRSADVVIANPGGRFGAWLADLLLSLHGVSAWWWVVFLGGTLLWGFRRLRNRLTLDRRSFFFVMLGFAIVLMTSSALENLRFHSLGWALPEAPGGWLGATLGRATLGYFGYTGGTLLLLALLAAGLSLFTGVSWLAAAEALGGLLERIVLGAVAAVQRWRDRQLGQEVAHKREEVVLKRKKKREEMQPPPLRIEPAVTEIPRSPRVEKERQRAEMERQVPLFVEPGDASATLPPLALLDAVSGNTERPSAETLEYTSRLIENKLANFGVEVEVLVAYPGPVITRYEIQPALGVKGSQVVGLAKDLARALSMVSIRVVEIVPGKSCMALELPNATRQTVRITEILGSKTYNDMGSPLTVALGKDIGGQPIVADLAKMPHLLVAGTTGSGKSVGINAMILSLLYKSTPADVRLIMVDPKMLELSIYEGIPHLLAPVVTDMKHAANALNWCVGEMEKRYKLMSAVGVRNLSGFNKAVDEAKKAGTPLANPFSITPEHPEPLERQPYIVVVIDELADLMMVVGKKVEELIARIAQKARAAGIHLILATQRPSVDVITGLIKANVPTRIAFQVSSKIDSRTILDQMGAEALLGMGDMLYLAPGSGVPVRVHGAFVSDDEVHKVVDHLKRLGPPNYVDGIITAGEDGAEGGDADDEDGEADDLYDQAVEIVVKSRRASISLVQRHLRIGYNRAARLIEQMERAGLVSPMGGGGNREVLAPARDSE
ncbi:DNA translocase FtsK [Betaproteobacteria bacterium]|nr:DNA translocase FtsK [Betaproteobacteria bacterium]GHU09036.1 DNA translocase FtsK [Betaproteobacteria bacterium]GHU16622.1 DNA translocase FtsK [Betaproteobacteria bacterium]